MAADAATAQHRAAQQAQKEEHWQQLRAKASENQQRKPVAASQRFMALNVFT